MSRNVSNAFKAAAFAQQTGEAWILLVTINSPNLAQPIRVASDPYEVLPIAGVRGVVSRGDEYIYLPFSISLPAQDDTGIARAKISIDNVGRDVVLAVRQSQSKISIAIEVVLASALDTVEMSLSDFTLDGISYDALTIEGEISVEYYDLEPYPARRFTPSDFPGIF